MAAKPAQLNRWKRAIQRTISLHHENLLALYEFGEDHGTFFLALEWVDGLDLTEHVKRHGTVDPKEAFDLATQAAQGLNYAHREGVIHGHIRPAHFLLTEQNGRRLVKLAGLDLAGENNPDD